MIRLLRTGLRPYQWPIVLVLVLVLVQVIANLYLPTLNADIIDQGVAKGDTDYILRTGMMMLVITFGQIVCSVIAVYFGARAAMSLGRDLRGGIFHRVGASCDGVQAGDN